MPTNEIKFDFFRKHRQPTTLKRMACMVVPTINHACHQFQAGRLPVGLKIAQIKSQTDLTLAHQRNTTRLGEEIF